MQNRIWKHYARASLRAISCALPRYLKKDSCSQLGTHEAHTVEDSGQLQRGSVSNYLVVVIKLQGIKVPIETFGTLQDIQYSISGMSITVSSILRPKCHLPSPGQKLSNNEADFPSSCFWLISNHARCVRGDSWLIRHLHHLSVPTSSLAVPWGSGGCTIERSMPRYFAQAVENGNAGVRGTVLNVAWKNGFEPAEDSAGSSAVSNGKTLT